jgi:hypothetical protein
MYRLEQSGNQDLSYGKNKEWLFKTLLLVLAKACQDHYINFKNLINRPVIIKP